MTRIGRIYTDVVEKYLFRLICWKRLQSAKYREAAGIAGHFNSKRISVLIRPIRVIRVPYAVR